ncbi:MAG: Flp family type IVb pilin [Terracidiphilus sp.]
MVIAAWKVYFAIRSSIEREDGQDLVEYALVIGLIVLAATAGLNSLAGAINTVFTHTGTVLGSSFS